MYRRKMPNNYKVLRNILSKTRQIEISRDMSYVLIYAFLYKYASDLLKNHFLSVIEDDPITLDEAYKNEDYRRQFRADAFNMFGYYIPESELFFDEVINEKYTENFFIHEFITAFSKNVEFPADSAYKSYFNFIFIALRRGININKFEFEGENHLIVKDLIFTISKLDIFEREFPFEKVFDRICDSKIIPVDKDPEYINSLLAGIVTSQKTHLEDIYNPFLNDASSLIDLSHKYNDGIVHVHAKGFDHISYCAGIVKFFINFFDLENVFLSYGSPFSSHDMLDTDFDVIVSRIPPITPKRLKRFNQAQNDEIIKRKNMNKVKSVLCESLGIDEDALENDPELKNTVDNLALKMNRGKNPADELTGEYESLKNSEYLFLINLIHSLKDDGIMAVSLSQGFLNKNSLEILRKYLTVEKNYIDCIISLPDGLSRQKRSEVIVVFRKNKTSDDIVFIDLSSNYNTVPIRYPVSGTFNNNLLLTRETQDKVLCAYNKRKTIDKFSNVVPLRDLVKNEFNLSTSRYVDTFEGDFVRLEDLKNQKEKITANIKKLNKKIDMMMDDLGIDF